MMTQLLLRILLVATLSIMAGVRTVSAATQENALVFGVYPYLSPSQVVTQFKPLADHLAARLGRPVNLVSAPDFGSFIERTARGEYDIVFTAPHMGRLAETRDGFRPLAQTGYAIVIVVLAPKNGPLHSLANLGGRSIAIGAKLSMTYQIVDRALGEHGLAIGRDVKFVDAASFSNVPASVLHGEADAGATGTLLWDDAPAAQRADLREIFRSQPVPGFLLLGHPRLGGQTLAGLNKALEDFKETSAGREYFRKTRQIDFRPVDAATMKRIDPFTAVFDTPR